MESEEYSFFIKELVENSLDHGAKNITVIFHHSGTESIEITDDGSGIPFDILQQIGTKK